MKRSQEKLMHRLYRKAFDRLGVVNESHFNYISNLVAYEIEPSDENFLKALDDRVGEIHPNREKE